MPFLSEYDAGHDLTILAAMAGELQRYLVEDELLWVVSGRVRGGMPRLTIGGLLLRYHRLDGLRATLAPHQHDTLHDAETKLRAVRDEWPVNFRTKLAQEWDWRVHMLDDFLRDCDESDGRSADCQDYWLSRSEHRTILHQLEAELERADALTGEQVKQRKRIDRELRRYLVSTEDDHFLWAEALAPLYPQNAFWWLWVTFAPFEDRDDTAETGESPAG